MRVLPDRRRRRRGPDHARDQGRAAAAGARRRRRMSATGSAAIGFTGEAGKLALVPGEDGRLGRVLVGAGESEAAMWALAGLPERCRRAATGSIAPARRRPIRAGWRSAGRSAPMPSRATARKRSAGGARLVWPKGADRGLVERLAGGGVPGARPGQHAGLGHGAGGTRRRGGAGRRGRRARSTGSSSATSCSPRTIRRSMRSAAPARRAPRLVDIVWGDAGAPKVTLVGKGVCFDTGGLDLKPASGMQMMKKDMGGRRDRARAGAGDHGGRAAGAAAGADAAASRTRSPAMRCGRSTSSARARA